MTALLIDLYKWLFVSLLGLWKESLLPSNCCKKERARRQDMRKRLVFNLTDQVVRGISKKGQEN